VWLPSLVEARYAHTERLTDGVLRSSNHFVAPAQFFANTWGFGPSVPGDQDGMPFTLGWPQLIIAAIGAIAIARSDSGRWKQWAAFFGVSAFVLCFLMTERAHELWDAVPQLNYVAVPWRLLASVAFCLALLASAIVLALPRLPERWQRWTYAAAIASIVLIGLPRAQPQSYLILDPLQWTPRRSRGAARWRRCSSLSSRGGGGAAGLERSGHSRRAWKRSRFGLRSRSDDDRRNGARGHGLRARLADRVLSGLAGARRRSRCHEKRQCASCSTPNSRRSSSR
jgi:hypothetical protein